MGLFEKHVDIFKKRDKESWQQIKAALKEAGYTGARSGHYLQETVMGGGCGRIDREIYWVSVPAKREEEAREILRRSGIVPEVEENVLLDAALRKKPHEDFFN